MSSRVPRKQRNLKGAAAAAEAASVEVDASGCTDEVTLEQANNHEIFGFGGLTPSYAEGEKADYASNEDREKQITGRNKDGVVVSVKDYNQLISRSLSAGLLTEGTNHYFSTVGTGVTGSSVICHVFGKSGPQAAYIPQLIHGSGLGTSQEYVFFLPASITGSGGSNMPTNHSRSFEITIAAACAPGESVQIYTASTHDTYFATGSAFTYSASFCHTPNYSGQTIFIPTGAFGAHLANDTLGLGKGIVIIYTASYAETDNKENTPYAGVCVSINPSAIAHGFEG